MTFQLWLAPVSAAVTVTCSGTVILSSVLFHLGRTGGSCTRGLSYLCCISHASYILSVIWVVEYLLHSNKIHLLGYMCACMHVHLILYYIFSDIFLLCLSHHPGSTVQRIIHDMWINIFIKECNSCIPPSTRYCCSRHKLDSSNFDLIRTYIYQK
jgi:hypothetical protein